MPLWWNWQTRWTQNPVVVIPCGFNSHHQHQTRFNIFVKAGFLFTWNNNTIKKGFGYAKTCFN